MVREWLSGRPLYGVVNNAGVMAGFFCQTAKIEDYRRVVDVNYLGTVRVVKAFLPGLLEAGGRVVNVTSSTSLHAFPHYSAYTPTKHAVAAFSDCLRMELRSLGVAVVQVAPGAMRTPLLEGVVGGLKAEFERADHATIARMGKSFPQEFVSRLQAIIPAIAEDPRGAAGVIEGALRSRRPKAVYFVGRDTRGTDWPLSCLPHFLRDAALQRMMVMPGSN
ncbi:unnamed protein product [Ostreobium quekettii]|uniref:Uncharacterized protein n=1 Tax=Ostreobium quekettii TaxID=121088 RepID=A0A8S1JEP5_9CHLO|nr:unnamed protein product [Ostreobium quekettii]